VRRGQCISRTELLEQVWQMDPASGTNVVDVYVNYLRRKLAPAPGSKETVIHTVRGTGYRLGGVQPASPSRTGALPVAPQQHPAWA
jgi:DNA-binding response OmpR family regulator